MDFGEWVEKQTVVQLHHGMLLSREKEISDASSNFERSWESYAGWEKIIAQNFGFIYIAFYSYRNVLIGTCKMTR